MNRRIKAIYLLTIFGILAFCGLEGYWLYQQYFNYLQDTAAGMYLDIANAVEDAVEAQAQKRVSQMHAIYRIDNVSKGDTTCYSGYIAKLKDGVDIAGDWVKEITDSIDKGLSSARVGDIFRFEDIDVSNAIPKSFRMP